MDNKNKALTVSEFCQQIKDFLPTKKFMVTGEVNQLKKSDSDLISYKEKLSSNKLEKNKGKN